MSPSSSSSSLVAELDTASKKPKFLVLRADPTVGGEDGNLRGRSRAEDIVTNSVKVKRSNTMMMAVWKAEARNMLVKRVSRLKVAFKICLWTHSLGYKRRPCEYTDPRLYTSSFKSLSSFTLRVEVGRN